MLLPNHGRLSFFILIITMAIVVLSSCSKEDKPPVDINALDENAVVLEGDVIISDTLTIQEDKYLFVRPGAHIIFNPGAVIVAHGNLYIEGKEDSIITLTAIEPIDIHRIITAKSGCDIFNMNHVLIEDGLITSYQSDNHFQNVTFTNTKSLAWDNAVARFWYGSVLIEDCHVDWNNQGEGFLLHNVYRPIVRNCYFSKVPDAVEYLHCNFGEITGCIFEGMNDDGIDQNHCSHTLIANNEFYNVNDKALELGSENFGSSDSLFVINNLFVGCRVGINVKESSYAKIENATFYDNDISLDVYTHPDSTTISSAEMFSSIIVDSDLDVSSNPRSETAISFCSSESELGYGNTNAHGPITLTDPDNRDYSIQEAALPAGYSSTTLGYQRK